MLSLLILILSNVKIHYVLVKQRLFEGTNKIKRSQECTYLLQTGWCWEGQEIWEWSVKVKWWCLNGQLLASNMNSSECQFLLLWGKFQSHFVQVINQLYLHIFLGRGLIFLGITLGLAFSQIYHNENTHPLPHSINFSFSSVSFLSSSLLLILSNLMSFFLPILSRYTVSEPLPDILGSIVANISASLCRFLSFSRFKSLPLRRPAFCPTPTEKV